MLDPRGFSLFLPHLLSFLLSWLAGYAYAGLLAREKALACLVERFGGLSQGLEQIRLLHAVALSNVLGSVGGW
jgi:hypothetical protein